MRVLFLLRKVDCNDGIASYCQTLAEGLGDTGIAVDMVSGEINVEPGEEKRRDEIAATLASWTMLPKLRKIPDPASLARIRRIIRRNGIDVINIHGLGMLIWGRLLHLVTGLPVFATYHPSIAGNLDQVASLALEPLSRAEKLVLRWCMPHRLIVLSDDTGEYLASQVPAIRPRILKVAGAVDDRQFRPPTAQERQMAREGAGLTESDLAIVHLGRLSWNKGQDLVIDAVRQVREQGGTHRLRCFFAGSGPDQAEMEDYAFRTPADRETFTFLGFSKARDALWPADLFILPSRFEGFGLAVVEAMLTGLVAIRTPSGGASEQIVDGQNGIIVPFDDVGRIADAIRRLDDPAERMRMRAASLAHARAHFTRDAMTAHIATAYRAAITA